MRIAVVTTHPPGAGSLNEYAFHFVRFLRQKPEVREVHLLVDELPPDQHYPPDDPGVPGQAPLHFVPCWRFGSPASAWRIRAAVRRLQPDVVLFNIQFASFGKGKVTGALGLTAPWLVKSAGVPTVVLLHNLVDTVDLKTAGFAAHPLAEAVIRVCGQVATRFLLAADLVALTMPRYVELLEERYDSHNVILAPHGAFDAGASPSFEPPAGPLQILTFGKFGTYKKVEILIEAYRRLLSNNHNQVELVIAGTDSPNTPGYLEGVRRRYAGLPGLRFTGYVPEAAIPQLFAQAALVVFPYTSTTGSSGVLHQAGNYGKAVVLPRLGDLAELITEEGYAGEFFEPGDPADLAEAIRRLLDDPARRRELGAQNFAAAHGLPMSDVVDWYLLHFQTLLKRKPVAIPSKAVESL